MRGWRRDCVSNCLVWKFCVFVWYGSFGAYFWGCRQCLGGCGWLTWCVCVWGVVVRGRSGGGSRGSVGACAPSHKAIEASCGTIVIIQAQFYEDHLSQKAVRTHARVNVMPKQQTSHFPYASPRPADPSGRNLRQIRMCVRVRAAARSCRKQGRSSWI
jgi:hypothetical protein